MKKLTLGYPHGGGGSWLSHLIRNLEDNCCELYLENDIIFDNANKSDQVYFTHIFEYFQEGIPIMGDHFTSECKLFSHNKPFNYYLNEAYKVRMYLLGGDKLPFNERVERLTLGAKASITDDYFEQRYYTNIALDASLIYTNSNKFIDDLFELLDNHEIIYTKNRDICHTLIKRYRTTCLNPIEVIGNTKNLYWLAWCHALLMINDIRLPKPFDFINVKNIENFEEALLPIQDECIELTKQYSFIWE